MKKNAIILCSGGIDSVVTAYYIKKKLKYKRIIVLFFNYGQRTLNQEKKASENCASNIGAKFIEIKLKELGQISNSLINKKISAKKIKRIDLNNTKKEGEKFYVPCRNTVFLSYVLALAESIFIQEKIISDIFVGFKCEGREAYPDTTQKFVNEINNLSKISCIKNFKVIAPLIKKDKEDIISLGNKLEIDFKKTYSCYIGTKNKNKHCGTCLACRLRQEGFYWSNITDPTKYKEKMNDFRIAKT